MPASAAYTLEIRDAKGVVARQPVATQHLVIGRGVEAHVRLDRATVSRRHAEILCDPFGRWWVRDLGSRNGTAVNGVKVAERTLSPGDIVTVGEFFLKFDAVARAGDEPNAPGSETTASTLRVQDAGAAGEISTLAGASPRLAASHLGMLSDFGQQLMAIADPADRLTALCRMMVSADFRGRSAVVLRLSKTNLTESPRALCEVQSGEGYQGWEPYISRSLLRAILARNEAILATNALQAAAGGAAAAPAPANMAEISLSPEVLTLSTVACPLRSDDRGMDLLYVILPPECATREWLALGSLAAKQFQQAENAWVSRKLNEEHAAIERELDKARDIQTRLVPRGIKAAGLEFAIGFKPCKWVGGDYVDVVPTTEGRVLLTVADVCGKGLPAALVASSLHTMVHTSARVGLPVADLMRNLNEYLCDTIAVGSFVTMLAVEINAKTGEFECVNAGHPPGFVIAPDGNRTELQAELNLPLGIDPVAHQLQRGKIDQGHVLALFTDGLTELNTVEGAMLGQEELGVKLTEIVRKGLAGPEERTRPADELQSMAADLTRTLDELQGEHLATDDRTFLLARRGY